MRRDLHIHGGKFFLLWPLAGLQIARRIWAFFPISQMSSNFNEHCAQRSLQLDFPRTATWLFPSIPRPPFDAFLCSSSSPLDQTSTSRLSQLGFVFITVLNHRPFISERSSSSISPVKMRYQNWDVLIFPDLSKIPFQEFKTSCSVIQDPGKWTHLRTICLASHVSNSRH